MPTIRRRRVTELTVFSAAIGVAVLHALDDAFLNRQPGIDLSQHALAALIAVAGAAGAALAFRRGGPAPRAALAFLLGALAMVNGAMHVQHIRVDRADHSDVTGLPLLSLGSAVATAAMVAGALAVARLLR